MESLGNSGNTSNITYGELISQDDFNTEGRPFYGNEEQVSKSSVKAGSSWGHYRRATLCLGLLSALLLVVDTGLGFHYKRLKEHHLPLHNNIMNVSNEVSKLQAALKTVIQKKDEARKQLATEMSQRGAFTWELEHQQRRGRDYNSQIGSIQQENTELLSALVLTEESCRRCLPGWNLLNSICYYFPFAPKMTRRSWPAARENCREKGADLAIIDSNDKQLSIAKMIKNDPVHSLASAWLGFWIGLTNEQSIWKWRTGTRLTKGYWIPGEPNSPGYENCAGIYAREDPHQTWNNAPCEHPNKWICEMAPKS